jgi:CheY-like chemotaxis protein
MKLQRIFLVDDDDVANYINSVTISDFAENIRIFCDGKEVWDYFTSEVDAASTLPDLILLDINMPHMDGFEFLEAFCRMNNERFKNIPFIMLSSSVRADDKKKALEYQVVKAYIAKPLTEELVMQYITDIINGKGSAHNN